MFNLTSNLINKAIDRLGLIRRSDLNRFLPVREFFSGETYPGSEWNIFATWSEQEFQKLAITNPWVYSAVTLIGREIALGTIGVEERNKEEGEKWLPINNHDFEKIVEGRPNPYMSQFFTWLYQVMWLMVQGEAYWMLVPNKLGELTQMYPLPANRVIPVPDPTGQRLHAYFAYTPVAGGQVRALSVEQVCFHRFPNLFNYHRGMSPLSAYLMGLQLDTAIAKFDLDDYQHGLTLRQLISMRPETSARDFAVAQADMEEAQRLGRRWLFIRGGMIDVKAVGSRRETTTTNANPRLLTREEANYVFGIPDAVRNPSATEASAKVAREVFISGTIWPLMVMLAEDMTAEIIHRFYEQNLRAMFEDIRPRNKELELKERDNKRQIQTYNEARADMNLEEHPDPDVGNAPYPVAGEVYKLKIQGQGQVVPQLEASLTPPAAVAAEGEQTPLQAAAEIAPKLNLNGAQVTAALNIVAQVTAGQITPDSGINALQILFNLSEDQAARLLGQTGGVNGKAVGEPFTPEGALEEDTPSEEEIARQVEEELAGYVQDFNQKLPDEAGILEPEVSENGRG